MIHKLHSKEAEFLNMHFDTPNNYTEGNSIDIEILPEEVVAAMFSASETNAFATITKP